MDTIIKLAATLVFLVLSYLAKEVVSFVKAKLSETERENLDKFIAELVNAAEQLHKAEDPDGSVRLDYVQGMLIDAGYDLTDAVRAKIESAVMKINKGGVA